MGKVKINNNLAALMLVASIFAGWGTLMIVTILMIIFCDLNDKIKPLIIKVVSFMAGITLILLGWDLVSNGIDLILFVQPKFLVEIRIEYFGLYFST